MAEKTAAEYRGQISEAYAKFMGELRQAGANWDAKPASGEGEEAWCARQVAEHLAGASGMFGHGIAKAAGLTTPGRTGGDLATVEAAIAAMPGAHDALMGIVQQLNDGHLGTELEFGPLGKTTLGNVLGTVAYHIDDHANQLAALRA